jgi:hypothetical protein
MYGQPVVCSFEEFYKTWIFHPDPKIDLAIMPIGGLLNHLMQLGKRVYYTSISSSTIPSNEEWEKFIVLEDIFVIGYPNALADSVNNLSLVILDLYEPIEALDSNYNVVFNCWLKFHSYQNCS